MIKFFRHIRQRTIKENRASKYLLYAIGEIVLVVIGILIALQINNWNEQRKLQSTAATIYTIVQSDLQSDLKSIDEVLAKMMPRDTVLNRIIEGDMTREDYRNCEKCQFVLFGFPDITLKSRGLTLLENNSTIFDSQNDSLFIRISEFYSYFNTEIAVDMTEVELDYSDNMSFFKNNKTWFSDYVRDIKNEEFVEYALNSPDYLNRVTVWKILYFEMYLGHLREYKVRALNLIEDLDKRTRQKNH